MEFDEFMKIPVRSNNHSFLSQHDRCSNSKAPLPSHRVARKPTPTPLLHLKPQLRQKHSHLSRLLPLFETATGRKLSWSGVRKGEWEQPQMLLLLRNPLQTRFSTRLWLLHPLPLLKTKMISASASLPVLRASVKGAAFRSLATR